MPIPVLASSLFVLPLTVHNNVGLRMEFYGCKGGKFLTNLILMNQGSKKKKNTLGRVFFCSLVIAFQHNDIRLHAFTYTTTVTTPTTFFSFQTSVLNISGRQLLCLGGEDIYALRTPHLPSPTFTGWGEYQLTLVRSQHPKVFKIFLRCKAENIERISRRL